MQYPFIIHRIPNREREFEHLLRQMDAATVLARNVLREPISDTFLGRKTQEPFPQEETE